MSAFDIYFWEERHINPLKWETERRKAFDLECSRNELGIQNYVHKFAPLSTMVGGHSTRTSHSYNTLHNNIRILVPVHGAVVNQVAWAWAWATNEIVKIRQNGFSMRKSIHKYWNDGTKNKIEEITHRFGAIEANMFANDTRMIRKRHKHSLTAANLFIILVSVTSRLPTVTRSIAHFYLLLLFFPAMLSCWIRNCVGSMCGNKKKRGIRRNHFNGIFTILSCCTKYALYSSVQCSSLCILWWVGSACIV